MLILVFLIVALLMFAFPAIRALFAGAVDFTNTGLFFLIAAVLAGSGLL